MAAQKEQQTTHFFRSSLESSKPQILVTMFAKSSTKMVLAISSSSTPRVCSRQSSQFSASSSSKSSSRVNAFGKSFPWSRQAQNHHQQRRQRQTIQTRASSKKRPKKQRENIYTMPDIGTTPYQMKDDLPAKGPEFDFRLDESSGLSLPLRTRKLVSFYRVTARIWSYTGGAVPRGTTKGQLL
jgi:hypothetical protein